MERPTVASLHRTTQAICAQICEKQTLQFGIAYYSRRFAHLAEANQFREVLLDDPAMLPQAVAQADRWFQSQGLICHRLAPAAGQPCDTWPAYLADYGYRPVTYAAMTLTRWPKPPPPTLDPRATAPGDPAIRVLPARAMRAVCRQTFTLADWPDSASQRQLLADACDERLNDPHFDLFVATVDKEPAGRCALLQVGDIARLMDLAVLTSFEHLGVDHALTRHALDLAKRLAMTRVLLLLNSDDPPRRSFFEKMGFVDDGHMTVFERQHLDHPDPPP